VFIHSGRFLEEVKMSQVARPRQTAWKTTGGSVGGSGGGGGRKRPICFSGYGACDCPRCREKKLSTITENRQRHEKRVKELGKLEASYIERNKKASGSGSKNPSIILQSQYRRVLGRHPEIHPLLHPDPAAAGVPFGNGRLMGSPLHSRWLLTRRDPEGSWKEILDMDSWNLGYINRLFFESDDRAKLADVMDSFCRDRLRLADVLDILGSTCVFQRLVPNRSNPREVVTSRQLDAAYHLEHPEPLEENRALGGEEDVNRDINQGRPLPAESTEPDDDLKNDREKVGKRKE